jgi:DNA-binding protein HU-beta
MNKGELVRAIAGSAEITISAAEKALECFMDSVTETMKKDEKLVLVGFGTFSVNKRTARQGRNPQTGKTIDIPAKNVPKFKAGSKLTEMLN